MHNMKGPVYMFPVANVSKKPYVTPGGQITPGTIIYFDGEVHLSPEFDVIFVSGSKDQVN